MKSFVKQERPGDWRVERFEPRALMGWETPVDAEPFLIRETAQYLIQIDGLGFRWDVAYLQDGKAHQVFVVATEPFIDDQSASKRVAYREVAREMLRTEVPAGAEHFRLKLPVCRWESAYV
jgi:hypothetical protein